MPRRPLGRLILFAGLVAATGRAFADVPGEEFFEAEVRPLLVERCGKCHGDDKPKGGLRLTSRAALLRGGDGGPAAVPGKVEESPIVLAVRYEDEPKMPPKGKLDDREIATLTKWVAMGLPWPETRAEVERPEGKAPGFSDEQRRFWSFRPIADPPAPPVLDASWPRGDIDRFLLAAVEARGLKPAPEADKATLIRRATFDLTGLPPSPEEASAFLADGSPRAFAKVVDRLLASPRYGERWGRHWLDVVRYADSRDARGVGGADDITEAWRYRDWVVSAFNRDLPYDQFLKLQVAGDTMPAEPSDDVNAEGLVATGLLAIGEWGTGDADKEKMITDIVDDQIDVVGRAFLGLTIACARCHDHKFDPIPTADYYGLAGIFFSTKILPGPGAKIAGSPMLRTPIASRARIAEVEAHKARLADLESAVRRDADAAAEALARRLLPETSKYLLAAWDCAASDAAGTPPGPDDVAAERGLDPPALRRWISYLGLGGEGPLLSRKLEVVLGAQGVSAWLGEGDGPSVTINATDAEKRLLTFKLPAKSVSVHPGPKRGVVVSWESPIDGTVRLSGRLTDSDGACGDGVSWSLAHRSKGRAHALGSGDLANGASQALEGGIGPAGLGGVEVRRGDSIRLAVLPKGGHICDTTAVDLRIEASEGPASWDLARDLVPDPLGGNPHADRLGHPGVWRFAETEALQPLGPRPSALGRWEEAARSGDRPAVEAASRGVQEGLDRGDEAASSFASSLVAANGPLRGDALADLASLPADLREGLSAKVAERDRLRANPPPPIPLALAALEGGVPSSAHEGFGDARIHVRGSYQRLGESVPRHFPRIVAGDDQPAIRSGSGRKELADWIARADHPLTSRVMANRIWQHHFGEGIVRTPSNFGKLGERPTHPELLDHLARRFVAGGWSIKAMHREIMLSSAYRQSSRADPKTLREDPENRLFARMNRRRLESEAIRDGLLAVAGRLDPAMGGPATRDFLSRKRTLYHMTIRSDRSSFGPLFDAADSTAMVDRRTVSTVAPQALFLLNHPFVLEQAAALSERIRSAAPPDNPARIALLYELAYGRRPTGREVEIGMRAIGGVEDRKSAWDAYCQVILCGNEFQFID